ncbi:MAG: 4Fe-4S binding protein [Bacteroidota bacterium]|nr:4Fe-4S binding protein [Bacteroidota bacterium]
MTVTDECINCSACIEECDHNAIYNAGEEYTIEGKTMPPISDDHTFIVAALCTSCKNCQEACAVDAIQD